MKKTGLKRIGYIQNFREFPHQIREKAGITYYDYQEFDEHIDHIWENRQSGIYCFDAAGTEVTPESNQIMRFIICTGFKTCEENETIYARFDRKAPGALDEVGWSGVVIGTRSELIAPEIDSQTSNTSVLNSEAPIVLSGRIVWVNTDDAHSFKGVIETEDNQTFGFNRANWINQSLSIDDISVDDIVEFELKKPNLSGKVYPKRIRFRGENADIDYKSSAYQHHSYGDFRQLVYLKLSVLKGAFINILEGFDEWDASYTEAMRDKIVSTYNNLSDSDFELSSDNETLIFPSGFEKNGEKIHLFCTKNDEADKALWYCDSILYNGQIIGGSVFAIINADWYDILANLKEFIPNFSADIDVKTVIEKIEQRCMGHDSLIWLADGILSDDENADQLYAPTGYYLDKTKELYLCCSYHKGIKGYGWYYDYITYENAPLEIYDKKDWLELWSVFDWKDIYPRVANQTLEEKWSFGERNDYSILRNYLSYIFAHQWKEGAVGFTKDRRYAAFNTGLPDKGTYKYIYAFFEKIELAPEKHSLVFTPQYRLKNFVLSDRGGDGKILKMDIRPLPAPPQFFKARSATVWELDFNDNNQPTMPGFDDTHILIQRCDRLPLEFYRRAAYGSEKLQNILNAPTNEWAKFKEIRDFFRPLLNNKEKPSDEITQVYQELYGMLERVISKAIRRLSWNWRAVVPCYNPEREETCFLLPVSFCDATRPDRAMIASIHEVDGEVVYHIHTVLPLEWAYLDARLVCRPESEWLAADSIL